MRRPPALLAVSLLVSACGGGDSAPPPVTFLYRGTLTGQSCFSQQPISTSVAYALAIDRLTAGATVRLTDSNGTAWQGAMTGENSLRVVQPDGDARLSITLTDVGATGARVSATASCVSFRCCDTVTGDVQAVASQRSRFVAAPTL